MITEQLGCFKNFGIFSGVDGAGEKRPVDPGSGKLEIFQIMYRASPQTSIHFLFFRMKRLSTSESSKENRRPPLVLPIELPLSRWKESNSRDGRRSQFTRACQDPGRFA
jgi:hypothetical protein